MCWNTVPKSHHKIHYSLLSTNMASWLTNGLDSMRHCWRCQWSNRIVSTICADDWASESAIKATNGFSLTLNFAWELPTRQYMVVEKSISESVVFPLYAINLFFSMHVSEKSVINPPFSLIDVGTVVAQWIQKIWCETTLQTLARPRLELYATGWMQAPIDL